MKFVFDTDVMVAAMRSPSGASAELLRMVRRREIEVVVSVALVLEYEAVLKRPEHLLAAGASVAEVELTIDALIFFAQPVFVNYRWRPQTRDPADEMVLEAAINANADAIITFNRRDFGDAPLQFGIGCWLPSQALEKMRCISPLLSSCVCRDQLRRALNVPRNATAQV